MILYALNHFDDHTYSQRDLAAIVGLSDPALKNQYEIEKMYLLMAHKKLNLIQNQEIDAKVSFAIKKHLRRPVRILIDNSVISSFFDYKDLNMQSKSRKFFQLICQDRDFHWIFSKANLKEISNEEIFLERLRLIHLFDLEMIDEDVYTDPINNISIEQLIEKYKNQNAIVKSKPLDAKMIAIAVLYNLDFLVVWDKKHIMKYNTVDTNDTRRIDKLNLINEINLTFGLKGITPLTPEIKEGRIIDDKVVVLTPFEFNNLFWDK